VIAGKAFVISFICGPQQTPIYGQSHLRTLPTVALGNFAAFPSTGAVVVVLAAAPSGAPLAGLAARECLVEGSVELIHPERLAKQLEPLLFIG